MKNIMFIFGTRPEYIKVFPIIKKIQKNKNLTAILVNTGQHKEMLNDLISLSKIKVDYDLEIMDKSNGLTDILTNSLTGIEGVIKKEKPDMILVHGDTSATLAGSIQAFYNKIPLGHVEAGLRTHSKYSPFPEEGNRQITGVLADLHFTPTETSKSYLLSEGKIKESVFVVGNTAIDTLKYTIKDEYEHEVLRWVGESKFILLTAHRRENIDQMQDIFEAINEIAQKHKEYKVIYPVHLNPLIQEMSRKYLVEDNIKLIPPLGTIDFHNIMNKAHIILTDSGGVQEEAPSLGKPVLVLRDTTERPEGVEVGTLKLIGIKKENIINETELLINNKNEYNKMSAKQNPYGIGNSAEQIVEIIEEYFERNTKI